MRIITDPMMTEAERGMLEQFIAGFADIRQDRSLEQMTLNTFTLAACTLAFDRARLELGKGATRAEARKLAGMIVLRTIQAVKERAPSRDIVAVVSEMQDAAQRMSNKAHAR